MRRADLPGLTGLRFFAAAAIVLHHIAGRIYVPAEWVAGWSLSQGVTVFFVLSGFILAYQHPERSTWTSARRFWQARLARIYPSHLVTLLAAWAVYGMTTPLQIVATNLLLLQSWVPNGAYYFGLNNVSWSISTEAAFYAAFPAIMLLRGKAIWVAVVGSAVVGAGMVYVAFKLDLPGYSPSNTQPDYLGVVMSNPVARCFEFILGVAAARLSGAAVAARRLGLLIATVIEAAAVVLMIWNVTIASRLLHGWLPNWGAAGGFWIWNSLIPAFPAALVIIVLARGEGAISALLSQRSVQYLGRISFALYLVHQIVFYIVEQRSVGLNGLFAALALSLLSAAALHSLVEIPGRRLVLSFFTKLPEKRAPAWGRNL